MSKNQPTKKNTALIFIDFQRDFCEPGGYASHFAHGQKWITSILPKAKSLLDWARNQELFVIFTKEGYKPDLSDCDPFRLEKSQRVGAKIGSKGPLGRFLIKGEKGQQIIDLLKPLPKELVIDKPTYGAFTHSRLERILKKRGITFLIIGGVTSDVCVHSTISEATDRGFYCFYVKDVISTPDKFLRKACEKMVEAEGGVWGELTNTKDVVNLIK
jgi:nicotinamidase-related amidase